MWTYQHQEEEEEERKRITRRRWGCQSLKKVGTVMKPRSPTSLTLSLLSKPDPTLQLGHPETLFFSSFLSLCVLGGGGSGEELRRGGSGGGRRTWVRVKGKVRILVRRVRQMMDQPYEYGTCSWSRPCWMYVMLTSRALTTGCNHPASCLQGAQPPAPPLVSLWGWSWM